MQQLNPWFSIWTQPRATIQQIVDTDAKDLVFTLLWLAGFTALLKQPNPELSAGFTNYFILFTVAAIAGLVFAVIIQFIYAPVVRWTGSWIGGQADTTKVRAAIAWSMVPAIWITLPSLWFIFNTDSIFATDKTVTTNSIMITLYTLQAIVGIWGFIISLKTLGQVQGFSAWLALANSILASLILAIFVVGLILGFVIFRVISNI